MSSTEAEGLLYSLVRQLAGCATPRKLPAPAPPAAASARELDLLRMRERARALDAEIDGLRRRLSGTPEQREEQAGWDLTQGLRAAWGQLQETLTPERAAEAAAAGGALLPPPPPPPVLPLPNKGLRSRSPFPARTHVGASTYPSHAHTASSAWRHPRGMDFAKPVRRTRKQAELGACAAPRAPRPRASPSLFQAAARPAMKSAQRMLGA